MIQKLSPAEYHAAGRSGTLVEWWLSKSHLFDFAASPYAWKYRHDRAEPREPTAAMDWGSAVDCLATSPDEFAKTVQFVDAVGAVQGQQLLAQLFTYLVHIPPPFLLLHGQRLDSVTAT
jgi:hypothetical protein